MQPGSAISNIYRVLIMSNKELMLSDLWCWRRLESPLDCREINQSVLNEINFDYSLEGLMLKLKLHYLGHLM